MLGSRAGPGVAGPRPAPLDNPPSGAQTARMRRRRHHSIVLLVAAGTMLASCGGVSERVSENVSERLIERAAGEDVDVDFDLDDENGGISVRTGAGDMAMGSDLPRPDWLPNGFPLPEGMLITYAVNDADAAQAAIGGEVPDASLEDVTADFRAKMDAYGARSLGSAGTDDRAMSWELPDGRFAEAAVIAVTDGGVQVTIAIDANRDIAEAEDQARGPQDSSGVAVANVDGERVESTGTCSLSGTFANFTPDATDPTDPQISVAVQGESVNGTVSVVADDGMPSIWILGDGLGTTTGSHDDRSIRAAGVGMNVMTGDTDVEIAIEVTCD